MEQKARQSSIQVGNPGGGDCGYYSIEISLLPILLEELRKAVAESSNGSIADFVNSPKFFAYLAEPKNSAKAPFLTKLYTHLEKNECRMDLPENPENQKTSDIGEQKKLFQKWLLGIALNTKPIYVEDPEHPNHDPYAVDDNSHLTEILLPGVYLLRTLTANVRRKSVKAAVEEMREAIDLAGIMDVETLGYDITTFEGKYKVFDIATRNADATTKINSDMILVLTKHMGQTNEFDELALQGDTAQHKELNAFAEKFVAWWREQNKIIGPLPKDGEPGHAEIKAAFIACLYGNIALDDETMVNVDAWWKKPNLHPESVTLKVADLVNKMKVYATYSDLLSLADACGAEISVIGENLGKQDKNKRHLAVKNIGGDHWVAYISSEEFTVLQQTRVAQKDSTQLILEATKKPPTGMKPELKPAVVQNVSSQPDKENLHDELLEIAQIATSVQKSSSTKKTIAGLEDENEKEIVETMAEVLHNELTELGQIDSIKQSPDKKKIVDSLIEILNPRKGKLTQENINKCKEQFMQNLPVLGKGMDRTGKGVLNKFLDLMRKILHITSTAASNSKANVAYKERVETISDAFGIDSKRPKPP
jgi:hypothetical protein